MFTHCEGKSIARLNAAPLIEAFTPVDDVAVSTRAVPDAKRFVTETDTTSGSPNADAIVA